MPLENTRIDRRSPDPGALVADRRLFLDDAGKVVEERDPTRAFLLIAPGQSLSAADAAKHGITFEAGRLTYLGMAKPEAAAAPEASSAPEAPTRAPARAEPHRLGPRITPVTLPRMRKE